MIPLLIGAVPVLILASLCSLALYCLLTGKKPQQQIGQLASQP
jgi:hypothetical protein